MAKLNMRVGVIGVGNMGSAFIRGIIASGMVRASDIFVTDTDDSKTVAFMKETGVNYVSLSDLIVKSDVIVIAVKPNNVSCLLENVSSLINQEKVIVSIAAGITIEKIVGHIGADKKIIRVMPNTAAMVGESMSAVCSGGFALEDDVKKVCKLFSCVGKTCVIAEDKMDAVVGLSGSSPAFIFQVIEAMGDAGVREGLTRQEATMMAAQAVLGAAKMVIETGLHTGALKDMVTSPSGTTIEGLYKIEKGGVRAAFIEAISAAAERSRELREK